VQKKVKQMIKLSLFDGKKEGKRKKKERKKKPEGGLQRPLTNIREIFKEKRNEIW
jgi:hypothetical protein